MLSGESIFRSFVLSAPRNIGPVLKRLLVGPVLKLLAGDAYRVCVSNILPSFLPILLLSSLVKCVCVALVAIAGRRYTYTVCTTTAATSTASTSTAPSSLFSAPPPPPHPEPARGK